MNTAYHFTPSPRPQSKHSTTFHITVIERPTQRQQLLLRQNAANSRPTATQTGVVNSVAPPQYGTTYLQIKLERERKNKIFMKRCIGSSPSEGRGVTGERGVVKCVFAKLKFINEGGFSPLNFDSLFFTHYPPAPPLSPGETGALWP